MKVLIKGVAPHLDGEYALDLSSFDLREQHFIRTVSGLYPVQWPEAIFGSDGGMAVALATIVCRRKGKLMNEEIFFDAPGGSIGYEFEEPAEDNPPTRPGKPGSSEKSSGKRSRKSSESPE